MMIVRRVPSISGKPPRRVLGPVIFLAGIGMVAVVNVGLVGTLMSGAAGVAIMLVLRTTQQRRYEKEIKRQWPRLTRHLEVAGGRDGWEGRVVITPELIEFRPHKARKVGCTRYPTADVVTVDLESVRVINLRATRMEISTSQGTTGHLTVMAPLDLVEAALGVSHSAD
jgi:hypothetical protein